jgi:ubiquinone biosynthesis protein COQ9
MDPVIARLIAAALPEVAFDGWSDSVFDAAVTAIELDPAHARSLCPRGAVDLAVGYHQQGDAAMVAALQAADMTQMRYRDKVAHAVWLRLQAVSDKEAVRRGTTLFALPHMAPVGAKLIWGTADLIWNSLGDSADDINWYTKRATLSGVYASVVLFWLGDDSPDASATRAFLDRRIDDVMQIEKAKAQVRGAAWFKPFAGPLAAMASAVKPPMRMPDVDLPGQWRDPQ